jgi:antitoxin component of RelBE/YafQ-DinJ toxin-antitoxin module
VATLTINNVDDGVRSNFEQTCSSVGINISAGINILMRLAIREKGMLLGDSIQKRTLAQRQRAAFEEFAEDISKCEPLGEDFDEVMKEGVHVRGTFEL